jgi:hypothetical protein
MFRPEEPLPADEERRRRLLGDDSVSEELKAVSGKLQRGGRPISASTNSGLRAMPVGPESGLSWGGEDVRAMVDRDGLPSRVADSPVPFRPSLAVGVAQRRACARRSTCLFLPFGIAPLASTCSAVSERPPSGRHGVAQSFATSFNGAPRVPRSCASSGAPFQSRADGVGHWRIAASVSVVPECRPDSVE